jgi:hypothetical protein
VSPLFIIVLALLAWEVAARRGVFGGLRLPLPRFGPGLVAGAAVVLVAAFAAQIALCDYQAAHDGIRPAWFGLTPYHFVDDAYSFGPSHAAYSLLALAIALVQTFALLVVVGGAAHAEPDGAQNSPSKNILRFVPFLTALALGVLALASPVVTSGDVFGYVGLGMLGAHPFARPDGFFHGNYAQVFVNYPLRPTIYGPVWIALNAGVVALGTTFVGKILALRIFGALLLALLAALARMLGAGRAVQWAIALNPMLWFQFATNAHNDLLAIVLVVAALVAIERRLLWIAVVLVASAGAVKLPFLVLGVVVFARHRNRRAAIAAAAASVALAVAVSAAFGGHAYLDALLTTGAGRVAQAPDLTAFSAAVAVLALGATAAALFLRRFSGFAAWLYPGLAPLLFPWYLAWTIPYLFAAGGGLLETLMALPIAATFVDMIYGFDLAVQVLTLAALALTVLVLRRRRSEVAAA